jgi:transposase-like protein
MKTRKKYDREFKQMAVELSKHRKDISGKASALDHNSPDTID